MSATPIVSHVLFDFSDGVATITLNRPEKLNAINPQVDEELRSAFEKAISTPDCRVIVLTGAGRGFCSGAERGDLNGTTGQPAWQAVPESLAHFRFNYLLESPIPVIAALNGAAIGVGLVIACYCDIRLSIERAKLSFPYTKLGLIAEYGIAKQLPNLIGRARATELLLTGREFSAEQAMDMGLIAEVYKVEEFPDRVLQFAKVLAQQCAPLSLRAIKRQLFQSETEDLLGSIQTAGVEIGLIRESDDYREALNARKEKRAPVFTGR